MASSFLRTNGVDAGRILIRESLAPELDRTLRIVGPPLAVAVGYYAGTRIGFLMTPSGEPNSTFWPANAFLLAAFLLAPQRVWWTFVLAVLPAHMLAQLQSGVPIWTQVGWFISNSAEAVIGAYCIARFSRHDRQFETLRGVLVFIVFGVLVAPFATSFLDAAVVVVTGWGRHYWPLGAERFWTNALAELTVVPIVVLCGLNGIRWIRNAVWARRCEAALLVTATIVAAVYIFGLRSVSATTVPAVLYVPLLLLLWAAVRFRLGGLSLSLLCITLISMWYTMHGRLPFPYASMRQNILSLQILFCLVAAPLMFLSALMDETQHAQESLRNVSAKLITAQEQERARIGRELHDDINQQLAMLSLELHQVVENPSSVEPRLREIQKRLDAISSDVQALSHDLHSSKLQYLGVVAGIKSWCREFAARQRIEIDFKCAASQAPPLEIGITLFRVLQEALHNVVKHSGVNRVSINLEVDSGEVKLTIDDSGTGFDAEEAMQGTGLGLISMRERIRLVNGTITIDSRREYGTSIHVRVPIPSEQDLERAG